MTEYESMNDYIRDKASELTGVRGIYILSEEPCGDPAYVGQANCIFTRYKGHVSSMSDACQKTTWIRSLLESGKFPFVTVAERIPQGSMDDREKHWIDKLFGNGESTKNTAKVKKNIFGGPTRFNVTTGIDTYVLLQAMSLMTGETVSAMIERLAWQEMKSNYDDSSQSISDIFSRRGLNFPQIKEVRYKSSE